MKTAGTWRIEALSRTDGSKPSFPYVLTIANSQGKTMAFRLHELWPPPAGNLYMTRYIAQPERDQLALVEEYPLLQLAAVHGKRTERGSVASTIDLAIDRPSRKRCSILVTRKDDGHGGAKEAIFLRTEAATKSHRSRGYLQPSSTRVAPEIVIDSRENYPWTFNAGRVTTAALRSGDYALRVEEKIVAVIERKTFQNMLTNLGALEAYHAHLSELTTYKHSALVIEAQYRDFLNPAKTKPVAAARCARALADISARHPNLQVHYAGNRKMANVWAAHFFEGCAAYANNTHHLDEPIQQSLVDDHGRANTGGLDAEIRHAILHQLPDGIRIGELIAAFPGVDKLRLSGCLKALRAERKLYTQGAGRGTTWHRQPDQQRVV